jgi:hypothetical protein
VSRLALIASGIAAAASLTAVGLVAAQTTNEPTLRKGAEEAPPAPGAPAGPATPVTGVSNAPVPKAKVEVAPAPPPAAQPKTDAQAPPDRRPRFPVAILQALDKVTAQSMRFEAPVGQPVRYHNLVFTVRSCETTTADEPTQDAIAFVEVEAQNPNPAKGVGGQRQVFKGWMFADSPSINPMQHPVYDAWLIACKA